MNSPLNWKEFVTQAGLPDACSAASFNTGKFSLLRVTGKDVESFLHAQLSNSVSGLSEDEVRFAAWCNAKGRVWTLVRYWRDADAFILRMPSDQMEATVKRLRMFVLRSDVQLEPLAWHSMQFIGPDAEAQSKAAIEQIQTKNYCIALPAAWPLYEVWGSTALNSDLPELPEELEPLPRILAGIPEVFADQREEWIPQMLNLDKLDGIDFKKGCYPGQEVVAKLHYKGGLKQRMYVGSIKGGTIAPKAGEAITDTGGKKVGNVVEASLLDKQCLFSSVVRLEDSEIALRLGENEFTLMDASSLSACPIITRFSLRKAIW